MIWPTKFGNDLMIHMGVVDKGYRGKKKAVRKDRLFLYDLIRMCTSVLS
jgi:hypothetical protein